MFCGPNVQSVNLPDRVQGIGDESLIQSEEKAAQRRGSANVKNSGLVS